MVFLVKPIYCDIGCGRKFHQLRSVMWYLCAFPCGLKFLSIMCIPSNTVFRKTTWGFIRCFVFPGLQLVLVGQLLLTHHLSPHAWAEQVFLAELRSLLQARLQSNMDRESRAL